MPKRKVSKRKGHLAGAVAPSLFEVTRHPWQVCPLRKRPAFGAGGARVLARLKIPQREKNFLEG